MTDTTDDIAEEYRREFAHVTEAFDNPMGVALWYRKALNGYTPFQSPEDLLEQLIRWFGIYWENQQVFRRDLKKQLSTVQTMRHRIARQSKQLDRIREQYYCLRRAYRKLRVERDKIREQNDGRS